MKKFVLAGLLTTITSFLLAQKNADDLITVKDAERIEKVLASDGMRGRKVYSPEIDKAADFIAAEFKAAGLQTFNKSSSYRQEFAIVSTKLTSTSCSFDNQEVDAKKVVVITSQPVVSITEKSGFEKITIAAGKSLSSEAQKLIGAGKNYLVLVDTSFAKNFARLSGLRRVCSNQVKAWCLC